MKKIIALLISLSLILLCGCSDNGKTISSSQTEPVETTRHPNAFTEWNSDLIPENFPDPIPGMHDLKIESGKASADTYRTDWVRITFTCFEKDIYEFSNRLSEKGYVGGVKNIHAPAAYYFVGFNGNWQDGKNIIRISKTNILDTGEIEFVFDILGCKNYFNEALESVFPKFGGYSIDDGLYYLYNDQKEVISTKFAGALSSSSWYWDFGYERAFIGVTMDELTAYENILVEAGFSGNCSTSVIDGCTVISYDLFKDIGDESYAIFMAYNQSLKILDVVYTNDASLFMGEQ